MRLQFCGADRTVTGSSHLLEINGLRIFLDMGMYQGARDEARRINGYLPADVKSADAIILSHAHLDHCGKLPVAVRAGFKGPIYCTAATAALTRIVLNDSAKIQQEDFDYLNRRARRPDEPPQSALYGPADIAPVLAMFKITQLNTKVNLGKQVSFTFYNAGHILGSTYIVVEWIDGTGAAHSLLFTGDVGRYDTPILQDPFTIPRKVDLLITESTYGNVSHGPIADVEPQLLDAVKSCIASGSRLLVPSFAIGRTQTVLWYLEKFISEKKIPQLPIFVDSPMGSEVTRVHVQFAADYDQQTRDMMGQSDLLNMAHVTLASSVDESKQINQQRGPCVIVASSPTCEFGRILHHLEHSVENPKDMVVFVGWIPPQTLGRRLQDGESRVRIYDRWYDRRCQVRTIHGLSAHADGDELLRFLAPTLHAGLEAFVVHGEVPQAEAFAARLLQHGAGRASVPAMESSMVAFEAGANITRSAGPARADQD